jgi:SET domain-containing protein
MSKTHDLDHFFYVAESEIHGKGLFARRKIRKGTYLGEYDGPETGENGMHVLWAEMDDGEWIGRDGQNLLRYINHSEKPCAEFAGFELFATCSIDVDQEITIHYGDEFEPD